MGRCIVRRARPNNISLMLVASRVSLNAYLLDLPAVVLTVAVVRRIQSMQERKFELLCAYQETPAETP